MKGSILCTATLFFLLLAEGQKRKRIRHSGRLLRQPDPIKCSRRPRQLKEASSGHNYFISENTKFKVSLSFMFHFLYELFKAYQFHKFHEPKTTTTLDFISEQTIGQKLVKTYFKTEILQTYEFLKLCCQHKVSFCRTTVQTEIQ